MSRPPIPEAGELGGPDSFRAVMDRSPVAFVAARGGVIRYVNPACARMHGVSAPDTLIGERLGERIAPGARTLFLEKAQCPPSDPAVDGRFETIGLRADGTTFAMLATVAVMHVADGQVTTGYFEDISERRNAEDLLKQAARFRAAADGSHDGILFADADAVILYRSPVSADINGYADEERIGRSGWEDIHPHDLPAVRRAWAQMLAAPERTVAVDYRLRHADGYWLRVDSKIKNLLHNPDVGAVVVNIRDVTDHKQAESERDTLYRAVENSGEAIFLTAVDGTFTYVNAEFTRMYGYPPEDVVGKATPRILKSGQTSPHEGATEPSGERCWTANGSCRNT